MEAEFFVAPKRLKGKSYALAAEKKEQETKPKAKPSPKEHFPAKPTPAGKTPEVVLRAPSSKKWKAEETDDTSDGEAPESTAPRPKRGSTKKAIIVDSDDDDADGDNGSDYETNGVEDEPEEEPSPSEDEDDEPSVKKPRVSRGKPTPPPTSSEENSTIETSDGNDEEEKPRKPKPKAKVTSNKGKAKASTSSTKSDDDSMDVDEPPSSPSSEKSSGKKRKAANAKDAPAKKQKRREDTDPWRLESVAVRRDWTEMKSPPLEIFHFARVVVDEYTYLTGKVHSMVTKLTADRRWVLSGTPPIHDFGAVKTIAAHLNLHLGIDDDEEGQSAMIKKRIREQTSAFQATRGFV